MGRARYRANCLLGPREPFKQDTVDLAPRAIAGTGGVFVSTSLTLSSAHVTTVGGIRHSDDFPRSPQKKKNCFSIKLIL